MKPARRKQKAASNQRRTQPLIYIIVGAVVVGAAGWYGVKHFRSPPIPAAKSGTGTNQSVALPPAPSMPVRAIDTNNVASLELAANDFLHEGRFAQAVALYSRMLQLEPGDPDAYFNLGFAYTRMRRTNDAIAAYSKTLELDANYVEAHINIGNIYRNQRNYYDATKHFSAALRIMPDHSTALNSMGHCLAAQAKPDEALAYFTQAVQQNPKYIEARYNLGSALLMLGRNDEAIAEFNELLRLDDGFRPAIIARAEAERRKSTSHKP